MCSKLYKKERIKFYSNLKLNQITDNKRYWKAIRPLLTDKCIQSSVITLINNENVIFDDFKLAQTFNNYFKNAVRKLRTKECEASSDMNANSRSKDGFDVAIEKYTDRPSIKMKMYHLNHVLVLKKYGSLIYKMRFLKLLESGDFRKYSYENT